MEAIGLTILIFLGIYGVMYVEALVESKSNSVIVAAEAKIITKVVEELAKYKITEIKQDITALQGAVKEYKYISTYNGRIINLETTLKENLSDFKFYKKQHQGMWRYLDIIMEELGKNNIVNEFYKNDGIELIRCKPIPTKDKPMEPLTYVEDERNSPLRNSEYVKEYYIKMKRDILENGYFDNRWYKEGNIYKVRWHFGNWAFVHGHGVYTYLQEKDFELLKLEQDGREIN